MPKKTYVIDTSVLIHDPLAIYSFEEHDVVLPYAVVCELDTLRKSPNGRGQAARKIIGDLENIRITHPHLDGVPLGEDLGSICFQKASDIVDIDSLPKSARDDMIIECAKQTGATIVSKDMGIRLKASLLGVMAEDYRNSKVEGGYIGLSQEKVIIDIHPNDDILSGNVKSPDHLIENEFCYVECCGFQSVGSILCRKKNGNLHPVPHFKEGVLGIKPLDDSQRMAFDVLTDDSVACVALVGSAGSGKTLLSLASGMRFILDGKYDGLMTVKPIIPVGGRDLGYLKGDKFDKLFEWQKPIVDNIRMLQMCAGKRVDIPDAIDMFESGIWQPEALTYMRGRSLHGYWLILDELQNATPHEVKTALSRVGEKTKAIMLADPSQIDNPYVDAESCGARAAIESLKGSPLFAVVPVNISHRSELAQLVADRM